MNAAEQPQVIQPTLFESKIENLKLIRQGKVRDIYRIDDSTMLIVTTDRMSAFDVVLPDPIPGKGWVLTQISNFWFDWAKDIVPNHLMDIDLCDVVTSPTERRPLEGRAIVVRRLNALPIEAVVRGYIIGSGWKDYRTSGAVCGIQLPEGLALAEKLPEPIFTPATKAAVGEQDENIDFAACASLLGDDLARHVREISTRLYSAAAELALERGIIVADSKFEFGLDANGQLVLIDEVLTPDSSRFWPAGTYRPGISPPSFDKQYVRDYLETLDWDKRAPGPELPAEIIRRTSEKYYDAWRRLTQA